MLTHTHKYMEHFGFSTPVERRKKMMDDIFRKNGMTSLV
jgi:hypothetical protein